MGIPMQGTSRNILLVDDEETIRDFMKGLLSMFGFQVRLAHNGREGLKRFEEESFDLVLTDVAMPVMDGWTLARCVKDVSPHTPVGFMTGMSKHEIATKLQTSAANFVLFKPFTIAEVKEVITNVLQ